MSSPIIVLSDDVINFISFRKSMYTIAYSSFVIVLISVAHVHQTSTADLAFSFLPDLCFTGVTGFDVQLDVAAVD